MTETADDQKFFGCFKLKKHHHNITINMNLEISPSDEKKYRILELENGLKVTLISQPPTNENEEMPCAASMVVGAGFYHEPRGVPGLAHFCEHLLFMGSEKYPKENTFEQFVAKYGGYYNASTNETFTRYYVSSMSNCFY